MGVAYKNLARKLDFSQMPLSRSGVDYECGMFRSDWSDWSDFWLWMQPLCYTEYIPYGGRPVLLLSIFCIQRLMLPSEAAEDNLAKQDLPNLKVGFFSQLISSLFKLAMTTTMSTEDVKSSPHLGQLSLPSLPGR